MTAQVLELQPPTLEAWTVFQASDFSQHSFGYWGIWGVNQQMDILFLSHSPLPFK